MTVPIRIPEHGETPLSFAEQQVAERLGIKPKRRYSQRFAWRLPPHPARDESTRSARGQGGLQ